VSALAVQAPTRRLVVDGRSVTVVRGPIVSGEGGVSVHGALSGRDAADSHPLAAVTGLADALAARLLSGEVTLAAAPVVMTGPGVVSSLGQQVTLPDASAHLGQEVTVIASGFTPETGATEVVAAPGQSINVVNPSLTLEFVPGSAAANLVRLRAFEVPVGLGGGFTWLIVGYSGGQFVSGVDSEGVAFTGLGLDAGLTTIAEALRNHEGMLDTWFSVVAVFDADVDITGLVAPAVEVLVQPSPSMGALGPDGTLRRHALIGQADPTENGLYQRDAAGVWERISHPNVVIGNSALLVLNAPGDPDDGTLWQWLDDDLDVFKRSSHQAPGSSWGESDFSGGRWSGPFLSAGAALDGKADAVHEHVAADVTDLEAVVAAAVADAVAAATARVAVLPSDVSAVSTTTLADVSGLAVALEASSRYLVHVRGVCGGDMSADMSVALAGPAGASAVGVTLLAPTTAAGNSPFTASSGTGVVTPGLGTALTVGVAGSTGGTKRRVHFELSAVVTTTTAGDLRVQMAQAVSTATEVTIFAGSVLRAEKVV
jgi:hypothetical protein